MTRTVLSVDTASRVDTVSAAIEAEPSLTAIEATSVGGAADRLEASAVDCVVTSYDLADGNGLDVVEQIRAVAPQTPCVLFTDVAPSEVDTSSFEETIVEYLNRDLPDAHDRLGFVVDDLIAHSAQVSFLRPDDEDARLDALAQYDVDNLPIEESFSRLTDLIASHFDAGVAFIGLIERDVEEFVACTGGDFDSLTRENTICTHSMLEEDVMVVEDVLEDGRFSENEALQQLGIRSYAGANMTTPGGHVIGQVCLLDYEPREYDAAERVELQDFAETAMEILELRKTVRDGEAMEVAR
jgi:GAF domain-containing protein